MLCQCLIGLLSKGKKALRICYLVNKRARALRFLKASLGVTLRLVWVGDITSPLVGDITCLPTEIGG